MPDGWLQTIADVIDHWGWSDDRAWAMTWRDTLFWYDEAQRISKSKSRRGKA